MTSHTEKCYKEIINSLVTRFLLDRTKVCACSRKRKSNLKQDLPNIYDYFGNRHYSHSYFIVLKNEQCSI